MPDPTDAVPPILRCIQTDVAQRRRETGKTLEDHGERLVAIKGYLVYELGLTTRAKADIKVMKSDSKSMKKRLAALEHPPSKRRPK